MIGGGVYLGSFSGHVWEKKERRARERYLTNLLEDVEQRLQFSIHHQLEVGLVGDQEAVRPPWGYLDPESQQAHSSIQKAYQAARGRLLVLGHAGAGKSTALLLLAQSLLHHARANAESPVPVLANLSRLRLPSTPRQRWSPWASSGREPAVDESQLTRAIEEWLIDEMHGVRQSIARSWLDDGQLVLLLDGLDEFPDSRRVELGRALNRALLRSRPDMEVVICSRINEYEALRSREASRLELRRCVVLQPLDDDQILEYLTSVGADDLATSLPNDGPLLKLARTPLTLTMIVLAYGGLSRDDMPRLESLSERRHHLFSSYVEGMLQRLERRRRGRPYDRSVLNGVPESEYEHHPKQLNRWMGWLALALSQRMRTTFAPRRLAALLLAKLDPRNELLNFFAVTIALGALLIPLLAAVAWAAGGLGRASPTTYVACAVLLPPPLFALHAARGEGPPGLSVVSKVVSATLVWIATVGGGASLAMGVAQFSGGRLGVSQAGTLVLVGFAIWLAWSVYWDSEGWPAKFVRLALVCSTTAATVVSQDSLMGFLHSLGFSSDYAHAIQQSVAALLISLSFFATSFQGVLPDRWRIGTLGGLLWSVLTLAFAFGSCRDFLEGVANSERAPLIPLAALATVVLLHGHRPPSLGFAWSSATALLMLISAHFGISGGLIGALVGIVYLRWETMPDWDASHPAMRVGRWVWRRVEDLIISPLVRGFLTLSLRLPVAYGGFLEYAHEAFLLRRVGGEFEFSHRLLRDYFALRELLPALRAGGRPQAGVIQALGNQGEAALETLVELADTDPAASVRALAIGALVNIPSPETDSCLQRHAAEDSVEVRVAILRSFPRLPGHAAMDLATKLLLRGEREEVEALVLLFERNRYGPWDWQEHLWRRLSGMEGGRAVRVLQQVTERLPRNAQRNAIECLGWFRGQRLAFEQLARHLESGRASRQLAAIAGFKLLGDPAAVPLLIEASRKRRLRGKAGGAIESLGRRIA